LIALPAIHSLARSQSTDDITVLTLPPDSELVERDSIITQVVYADTSNPRKSVEALLKCYCDLIVSDTNYDGIKELIQYHYYLG
jgi:hypothetical protein